MGTAQRFQYDGIPGQQSQPANKYIFHRILIAEASHAPALKFESFSHWCSKNGCTLKSASRRDGLLQVKLEARCPGEEGEEASHEVITAWLL